MNRVQAKLNNSVHCMYGSSRNVVVESCFFCFGCIDIALAKLGRTSAFYLTLPYSNVQLITILAEISSVGLTCERISTILILQEFQPFYLMKWVWTKLNNTFHQESWSTHFAWNSNTVYSSHCTVVLNQT